MMDCICSFLNNALQNKILTSNSINALEHAKTITNCNSLQCFENLDIPDTDFPIEYIVASLFAITLFITRPKSVSNK